MPKDDQPTSQDGGRVGSEDSADVVVLSREEYTLLVTRAEGEANPAPAIEEGPHLKKAAIRQAKREQLREAGLAHDDESLTDDMRSLLAEED